MTSYEAQYVDVINELVWRSEKRVTRNGNTHAVFGKTLDIDVNQEFPLLLGRKLFYKPVLGELAAMFRGPKNIADFKQFGCNYWDKWGAEAGDCLYDGSVAVGGEINVDYGNSWIDFNGVNQLEQLVAGMTMDPTGRRHIVSGWRPDHLKELSLPCCHTFYQFYIRENRYIDMMWYQRSADWMIGVPADAILGAAWLIILAQQLSDPDEALHYEPGRLKMVFGDTHIYENHMEGVSQYLTQYKEIDSIVPIRYAINMETTMQTFVPDDLIISDYEEQCKPVIKFPLNV